jgi:L-histidine N-alpha-methyltransferase
MSLPLPAPGAGGASERDQLANPPIRDEVLRGLLGTPRTLPPKLFYDDVGARLFERICALPEYYLTRTELEILRARAANIAELAGERCALIEYGSGAGVKVRILLDALDRPEAYVPVDISRLQLCRVSESLAADYPGVRVRPVCADYTERFQLPSLSHAGRRVAFFPGSSIGNFHPSEATAFLGRVRHLVGPRGAMVLGVDRRKDAATLNAAYNDREGVTAAFNRNILVRLNREFGANFDLSLFRHRAYFNEAASRVEMHLECTEATTVWLADHAITFARGETIWTECSYKYERRQLDALVAAAGFRVAELWSDERDRFWVAFLSAE